MERKRENGATREEEAGKENKELDNFLDKEKWEKVRASVISNRLILQQRACKQTSEMKSEYIEPQFYNLHVVSLDGDFTTLDWGCSSENIIIIYSSAACLLCFSPLVGNAISSTLLRPFHRDAFTDTSENLFNEHSNTFSGTTFDECHVSVFFSLHYVLHFAFQLRQTTAFLSLDCR